MATKDKSMWILIVFILAGVVIGGLVGDLASKSSGLWWLAYGQQFGLINPLKLNISSILGKMLAIFIYRKL